MRAIALLLLAGLAQAASVGIVDFPVTAKKPATQACFNRAVAMLHSFWFEEAREQFESCAAGEPDFAMAWWGVAMTHNHSLWNRVWPAEARAALGHIGDTARLSKKEQAWIDAVRLLFSEGKKRERELAYSKALEQIHRANPDDLEAAAFYSLSLIAIERNIEAGAIALDVYGKQPEHPGAAHYIIHAFDDPVHAILALPAARRYAGIAPEAHHARHMPSHIFLQLGMWPETVKSNEQSWAASVAWQRRKNLSLALRDYHSQYWLAYGYLQMGRPEDAWKVWEDKKRDIIESQGSGEVYRYWAELGALLVVSTGAWDRAAEVFSDPVTIRRAGAEGHAHQPSSAARALEGFTRGWAAALKGDDIAPWLDLIEQARQMAAQRDQPVVAARCEAQKLMVEAIAARRAGRLEQAIALLDRAQLLEEQERSVSGPPDIIKPSHELAGEMLLEMGRKSEARSRFEIALKRQPKRRASLEGLARTL
jgi:tetratricopeptide (TPR) repeat protein